MKIRVTKEFDFEAAHALDGYAGKCQDIHGHNYHLTLTFLGEPVKDKSLSNCGMVVDFGDIKDFLNTKIKPLFDHRLILRSDSRFLGLEKKNERIRYVDYQPTTENMLLEIVKIVSDGFKKETTAVLCSAFLRETPSSYVEWHKEDQ
ncbi:MAG: 6-pyruvoyl trahydropterin synthase family protein [Parvicellaceae bacterium]